MIINWKPARALILHPHVTKAKSITIVPGINVVPDDQWALLRESLADRLGKDLVEVEGKVTQEPAKGPGGKEITKTVVMGKNPWEITDMNKVEELILQTNSIPLLTKWREKESRDSIRASIANRIDDLKVKKEGK